MTRRISLALILLFGVAGLGACDNEPDTPSERLEEAGEAVEEGIEETGDKIEEAGDEIEDAADEAG